MAQRIGGIKEIMDIPAVEPILYEPLTEQEGKDILSSTPFYDGVKKSAEETKSPTTSTLGVPEPLSFDRLTKAAPAISAGLAQSPQPVTPSALQAGVGVAKAGLGGAISGAVAGATLGAGGGPMGAVIGGGLGLLFGGVDAYFNVKNARAQSRAAKRMNKAAREANDKALAEARKWQRINRMDSLEQARQDRNRQLAKDRWTNFNNSKGIMTEILNGNQTLANNFRQAVRT